MPKIKINNLEGTLEEVTELSPTKDYGYSVKNPGVSRTKLKICGQPPIIFYKRINPELKGRKISITETSLATKICHQIDQILKYNGKKLEVSVFKIKY